jgi:fucokinase
MARARTAKTSSKPTAAPGFDLLVLTVANRVQQRYAERMLEVRRRLGALPAGLSTVVLADPAGKRIGSGGSTILCMAALAKRDLLRGKRIMVLHSGGDSRRLPAWSAAGKIWVPLERLGRGIGPMGSPALFDLAFAELARLSLPASGGVLVASGDAALRLKGERVQFGDRHATVLAFPGDADRASRHGVFVLDRTQRVIRTLQKPSPAALRDDGALDARGRAMIDSGIFFFPTKACEALLRGAASMIPALARGTASLDLYQEIAESMAKSSTVKEFVGRFVGAGSAGTKGGARRAKQLSAFHAEAHGIALHASLLRFGSFLHLGTTRELAERLASHEPERMFPDLLHPRSAGAKGQHGGDEHVGVRIGRSGGLPAKLAAFDVPLAAGRHCAVVHGIDDDCKTAAAEGGTFAGKPLRALPARTGLAAEAIWGSNPHTLWHARIFPVGTRSAAHDATQWMVRGTKPTPAWRRMPRASLADVMLRADAEALATLHAHALLHAPWSPRTSAPLAVARRHAALEAIASAPEQRAEARIHAMAAVGAAVERDITLPRPVTTFAVRQDQAVWASAPVRIDLAGGWSDTPPLCIEHGGAVVNAAVTLGGTLPLQAMVRVTEEPAITLHSVDAGRTAHYRSVRELLDHRDPSQWDALPRAALVLSGLVPREPGADLRTHLRRAGGGLAITLFSAVPRGSGLGTSSILGATLLATLDRIAGHATDPAHIARGTSLLEQMISTRGGWQDQVGGLWGGIKLCTTRAGIHQVPDVAPITPPASFTRALHERAVLFYSGQRRMARGILETVVMRYLRGERAVLDARARLVDGAHAMAAAITAGDLDEFGRRLAEYRELKRTVDPASVTPLLEAPIDALGRDVASWSFAGAGGGGFVILLCRSTGAAERVRAQLNRHPPHPLARPFPFDLDAGGMRIAVL